MTVYFNWKHALRERLQAGGEVHGESFRHEVGRKVDIYGFLKQLEEREGWEFDKTMRPVGGEEPVECYRLRGARSVERPQDVIVRRLLDGETLDEGAIIEELNSSWASLAYVKTKLRTAGFEFDEHEVDDKTLVSLRPVEPPPPAQPEPQQSEAQKPPQRPRRAPRRKVPATPRQKQQRTAVIEEEEVPVPPARKPLKFGVFEIK